MPTLLAVSIVGTCATTVWLRVAAPVSAVQSSPEVIPAPPAAIQDSIAPPHYIGSGSCAARACHGSPTLSPGREWNSAYAIWAANDPHAQSYSVLFTPESKRMAAAIGLGEAAKAERCLACHSLPVAGSRSSAALNDAASLLSDGVGCEACHGPAENYLAAHTMRGWQQLGTARFVPKFGMNDTQGISARAKICVGCHVGQSDAEGRPWRDVNHDLIAAGHPRLNFEFSAYMAALPPHWNTQKDKSRFEELQSWIAGQFAASEAALRLLESRAKTAQTATDADAASHKFLVPASWPELSEYDCYACHHGLSGKSWRQDLNAADVAKIHAGLDPNHAPDTTDRPQRRSGAPAWGTWYYEGPRLLAGTEALTPHSESSEFLSALNALTKTMQTPLPGTTRVAEDAVKSRTQLTDFNRAVSKQLAVQPNSPQATALRRAIIHSLATQFQRHKPESWDEFVQNYLALVAVYRSEIEATKLAGSAATAPDKQSESVLEAIRNRLSFPSDLAAPTAPAPSSNLRVLRSGLNSPEQFDPYFKPSTTLPGELAGKNLFELFDEAFRLLSDAGSTS